MIKPLFLLVCFLLASGGLNAQTPPWEPSSGHTQLPIWPGKIPDAQQVSVAETATTIGNDELVAGKPWMYIQNVSRPTMTVYSPQGKNTGAAVVACVWTAADKVSRDAVAAAGGDVAENARYNPR